MLNQASQSILKVHGGCFLEGEVQISGAKNAALTIMAATLLSTGDCCIRNVPHLTDVMQMATILTAFGAKLEHYGNQLDVDASNLTKIEAPIESAQQLRASFFVIGPLLARLGMAKVPLPGGCVIGARPVDLHLRGLQAMGADIKIEQDVVHAQLKQGQRLQGAKIYLDYPSVGATQTLLMAATLAEGETIIENAAREPEVVDLANFCRAMGAQIRGAGTSTITISGVSQLYGADHRIIPDRIEAGTFLVASAITHSPLTLTSVNPQHLQAIVRELSAMGAIVTAESPDRLHIVPGYRPQPRNITTRPYPGFPTDLQPQFMALLSRVEGNSTIIETVFENRFRHAAELNRMGAGIHIEGNQAVIRGVPKLLGTSVMATDLRAAAALVLAALAAESTTTIHNFHYLNRGYENLEHKLRQLGANLEQETEPASTSSVFAPQPILMSANLMPTNREQLNYLITAKIA